MAQPAAAVHAHDYPEISEHKLIDPETETSEGHTLWKLPKGSNEGQTYAKLSTDDERVEYMRQHHQSESKIVFAQWTFYVDSKERKRYSIRIDSPEGEAVRRLQGDDSDVEAEAGSKEEEVLLQYFKKHAHKVELLQE